MKYIKKIILVLFLGFSLWIVYNLFIPRLISDCPLPAAPVEQDSHWSAVVPNSSWDGWDFQFLDSIAFDSKGRLYAAGYFSQIGGIKTVGIARWDPEDGTWHSLGMGLLEPTDSYNEVHLIVDPLDRVYVSGNFNMAGDQIANGIAMWDGQDWHTLGGGLMDGRVYAMAPDGQGNLYIGGDFSQVGTVLSMRIARWNGQDWQDLTSMDQKLAKLLGNNPDKVTALAYDSASKILYASGMVVINNRSRDFIAAWQEDNQTWKSLSAEPFSYINTMKVRPSGEVVTAGSGEFGFTSFDPNRLVGMEVGLARLQSSYKRSPAYDEIYSGRQLFGTDLAFSKNGNIYVGGQFESINGHCMYGVARWNGINWSPLGSGILTDNNIGMGIAAVQSLALDPQGKLYVAGAFRSAGGKPIRYLARWTP